jgi:hypothetical protein
VKANGGGGAKVPGGAGAALSHAQSGYSASLQRLGLKAP